eukprot:1180177-Prorocentrum_minimum.AAC.2
MPKGKTRRKGGGVPLLDEGVERVERERLLEDVIPPAQGAPHAGANLGHAEGPHVPGGGLHPPRLH